MRFIQGERQSFAHDYAVLDIEPVTTLTDPAFFFVPFAFETSGLSQSNHY
jgi:hypothetical protein